MRHEHRPERQVDPDHRRRSRPGTVLALVAAIGIGLALGAEVDVIGYLTSRYYGLASSRMFGVFYAVFTRGIGASPRLMAWLRAATGSYFAALVVAAGLLVGASALLTAPRFPRRPRKAFAT
ncbi:hypothetical protein [Streptantibioticus ferralitis]|uniref:Major facilitator superfamily (MFS) profile domain-containing protein n=1 Tax=Streptantibioticus ferralitis TaxID=236510 RepID=A0ABT5ZB12_9ACTN|nr:hypothetical protein [Streptantibioticus ferralitis]MDF2261025.1 hypothetical protein [Streptantibioticus ferralitis]